MHGHGERLGLDIRGCRRRRRRRRTRSRGEHRRGRREASPELTQARSLCRSFQKSVSGRGIVRLRLCVAAVRLRRSPPHINPWGHFWGRLGVADTPSTTFSRIRFYFGNLFV